jgi:hypothetical protein
MKTLWTRLPPLWHETGSAAGVVELVDALDSKSSSERSAGSTPAARTTF